MCLFINMVHTKTISGNHHNATVGHTTEEQMKKLTLYKSPSIKPFFTPQRLIVTAPLDTFGRPQTTFSVQSKLIEPLPPNCMCYLESLYINNFVGNVPNSRYGTFTASTAGFTISSTFTTATTLTIITNPPNISFTQYDLVTFSATTTANPAVTQYFLGYISTASSTTPQIILIDPTATTNATQIPVVGNTPSYATSATAGAIAAQTLTVYYTGVNAFGTAMLGMGCINIELMDYINPNVFDTNQNAYSRIIGSAPVPPVYVRQNLPQELQFFLSALENQVGYHLTDAQVINNNNVTFRVTYNAGGANNQIPQPAAQYSVVPFNLVPNYTVSSGNLPIPYGSKITTTAGSNVFTATSSAPAAAPVYVNAPLIRFTLAFYPFNPYEN